MSASFTFLTPLAASVAVAIVLPLAALALGAARVRRVRAALSLRSPQSASNRLGLLACGWLVAALAVAAAQPAVLRESRARTRSDVEVLFVIDVSRSMAASRGRLGPTRLERAVVAAKRLRASVGDVPSGIATLTDRVLPNLFPVPDAPTFDTTLERAVALEAPPPRQVAVRATTLAALAAVPNSGYFAPSARTRVIVLLTDGETRPIDASAIGGALAGTGFLAVRFWRDGESVFNGAGRAEPSYRPDASGLPELRSLASAAGGRAFDESDLRGAFAALREAVGEGPTVVAPGRRPGRTALGPYIALSALAPLAFLVARRGNGFGERPRRPSMIGTG